MLSLTLALALTPQATFLRLASAGGDDDGPSRASFTPSGGALVVWHEASHTLTHLSLSAGAVTASAPAGDPTSTPRAHAMLPSGNGVLFANFTDNSLSLSSVPSMVEAARLLLSINETGRVDVDSTGAFAVVSSYQCGQERSVVVDLTSFSEARSFVWPTNPLCDAAVGLALDDVTFVVPTQGAIVGIDVTTGLESGRTALSAPGTLAGFALSGDRSRAIVLTTTAIGPGPAPTFVEAFALPSLTSLGARPLGTFVLDPWRQPVVDAAGTRALVFGEATIAVEIATGAARALAPRPGLYGDASLTSDGARAVLVLGAEARVFDAATGALAAVLPLRERARARVIRAPNGTTFAALGERVELIDLAGPTPQITLDAASGFAAEWDGPFASAPTPDGARALITAAGSDDLHLVDLTGVLVDLGRVQLDAEPRAIALRADGAALVAHRRGASLSVVDTATLVEVARWPLPAPGLALAPATTGSDAWVYTEDLTTRQLVRIDTATGAVLAQIDLEGAGVLPAPGAAGRSGTTVVFDVPHARAFAARPATGIVEAIDLASGVVAQRIALPTVGQPIALALAPDGARLYHTAADGVVRAFDTSAAGLALRWTTACAASSNFARPAQISVIDGGAALVVDLAKVNLLSSPCPQHVLLDASTGAELSAIFPAGNSVRAHYAVDDELLVLEVDSSLSIALTQHRLAGATLGRVGGPIVCAPYTSSLAAPIRSAASGLTYAIAEGDTDMLVRFDLVDDERVCAPAPLNGLGRSVALSAAGSGLAGDILHLRAEGLQPGSMLGYLLTSLALAQPYPAAAGIGVLCLAAPLQRLTMTAQVADGSGSQRFAIDTGAIATPLGPVALQPGDSWCFQTWFRDRIGGAATSNTSDALRVTFR
ncbi:MAG: hypothetical protein R3F49_21770 [Planctomycetota bacterium]